MCSHVPISVNQNSDIFPFPCIEGDYKLVDSFSFVTKRGRKGPQNSVCTYMYITKSESSSVPQSGLGDRVWRLTQRQRIRQRRTSFFFLACKYTPHAIKLEVLNYPFSPAFDAKIVEHFFSQTFEEPSCREFRRFVRTQ